MQVNLNPKLGKIKISMIRTKMGLLVGFGDKGLYRRLSINRGDVFPADIKYHNNVVMTRCWHCGERTTDSVRIGALGLIQYESDVFEPGVIAPDFLESVQWCNKCSDEHQQEMAQIVCNSCNKIVAYSEAGKMPSGFEIKDGMILHVKECPICNPAVKELSILEDSCQRSSTSSTTDAPKTPTSTADHQQEKRA